ncbi:MAG: helix-turn-helix transcriptional regulator, partial [Deltaproteobacteria bacterium]|nr:helix-turn-helix transcriptional regulator [Deltaproteobacteria bacterium]
MPKTRKSPVASPPEPAAYLTTAEVARVLRVNQKKVYAMLQERRLPAARVSGKWLFPRELLERWVAEHTVYPATGVMGALLDTLLVLQGSDDWLLGRVIDTLRARSGMAVATAPVGSLEGLKALARGGAHAACFHLPDEEVTDLIPEGETWYVLDLAEREQGLMYAGQGPGGRAPRGPADLVRRRLRLADRQVGSGTHRLVRRLVEEAGEKPAALRTVGPYSSHIEVGLAVRAGLADVGMGVRVAAKLCGLSFRPLRRETFRLAVPARHFGHPRMVEFFQALLAEFGAARKRRLPGYSFEPLG